MREPRHRAAVVAWVVDRGRARIRLVVVFRVRKEERQARPSKRQTQTAIEDREPRFPENTCRE